MQIIVFETRDQLMQATADRIADALQYAIGARGAACVALSGGSTPAPAYAALAALPLDWEKITLALVDERFVPPTHNASNEGLIRRTFAPALAAGATIRPMFAYAPSVAAAADIANADYAPLDIDIALMGMGADGHTASWFDGAQELDEALDLANPRAVIALRAAQADGAPERLTLTRAALARADRLILLLTGQEKRTRLASVVGGDWAPVAALFEPPMPAPEILWAA